MTVQTYEILNAGMSIRCLVCNCTSHDASHVAERYCPRCHWFHDQGAMFGGKAIYAPYPD